MGLAELVAGLGVADVVDVVISGPYATRMGDPRVTVVVSPGAGISAGRNIGIERARHDLVACTDVGCEPATGVDHPQIDSGRALMLPGDEMGRRIGRVELARKESRHPGVVQR